MKRLVFYLAALLLTGCATQPPMGETAEPPNRMPVEIAVPELPPSRLPLPAPLPYEEFFSEVRESIYRYDPWYTANPDDYAGYYYDMAALSVLLDEDVTLASALRPGLYVCVIDGTEMIQYNTASGERTHLLTAEEEIRWLGPDLHYFFYLMGESIYRFYLPDMINDFITECPGVLRYAEYKKHPDISHWSNVEIEWETMNEDFLAVVDERGLVWDELSDDVELDHLRFDLHTNDVVGNYYNAMTGESSSAVFPPYSNDGVFWWWGDTSRFRVQRPGYMIYLPETYFSSVSITPSQLMPEGVIFEAYLHELRAADPMDGLVFRITRTKKGLGAPEESWEDGIARRCFAWDGKWYYCVETSIARPFHPSMVDPYRESASLDTILSWFIEDNGLTARTPDPAPETVMAAAERYVQSQVDYWRVNTGAYGMVDGKDHMLGTPAVYDGWRVNSLTRVFSYETINGTPVNDYRWHFEDYDWEAIEVYRLDYRIHTTTPDKVILAGGMILEEDGWLLPTYRDATYLICKKMSQYVLPLFSVMINDSNPGNELFTNDLDFLLIDAGNAWRAAAAALDTLFADGTTAMWYVAAGDAAPTSLPERHVRLTDWHKGRADVQFNSVWQSVNVADYPAPLSGPSLCMGDGGEGYFQFYLGTDYVLWRDGENVTAWRVNDNWGSTLPDCMMGDYGGYEADIRLVSIPATEGETVEEAARRFMDAYGAHLRRLSPESLLRIADFQTISVSDIQTNDTRILFSTHFAIKPPAELYDGSHWWAGNTDGGTGDRAGWLTMGREILLERSGRVWHCLGAGTGGGRLDGI